jgi:hypothetical protein
MRRLPLAALIGLLALPAAAAPPAAGDDARAALDRWETASRSHLPVTEAERLRLRYASPDRSGQELDLTCELQGPIDAADLARRYDWTMMEGADAVVLTAVPKDRLEGLFYDRFSVTLDATTCRPTGVRFETAAGEASPTVALRPWVDDDSETAGAIEYVGFESPEDAAERPIRTAELADDLPGLLRNDVPLALTPAPVPHDIAIPLEPVEAPRPNAGEPAALRDVLEKFDRNYASAERVSLKLFRWRYDNTFDVEKRDRADVWLENHERGWVEFNGVPVETNAKSDAKLALRSGQPDGWRWEPDRVTHYDPAGSTYETVARAQTASPPEWGQFGSLAAAWKPERALPVWTARSAEALRERFDLKLVQVTEDRVYVSARPRTRSEALYFRQIEIIFDRETGYPRATKVLDPTVNGAVVFSAQRIELNGPRPPVMALKNPIGAERALR